MFESKNLNQVIACNNCAQLISLANMQDNTIAKCSRCGAKLFQNNPDTLDRTLALAFTSLILFVAANVYPFLTMQIEGFVQQTNLITGIFSLYHQEMTGIAILVFLTTFIFPLFQMLGLIYVYLPMRLGFILWKSAWIFRAVLYIQPWGMLEVYMLGILISMIKLAKMATIIPGLASGAFLVLIFVFAATLSGINPDDIWKRMPIKGERLSEKNNKKSIVAGCHCCSLLCQVTGQGGHHICPRCQSPLHIRKTNSINRTWALVIAAGILYFPANIFPITVTSTIGHEQSDTILSGVIYFFFSGSWHIALIIFIASVVVPLMKLILLIYLLISVQRKSFWKPEDRTRIYRMTEAVGRWSMVDVFVVTILVSLVQLGPMANIEAGPGVLYFSGVVVITMFAAESFDPRLIWDAMEENQ